MSVVGADNAKSQRRIIVCARRCNVMCYVHALYINGRPPTPGTKMHNMLLPPARHRNVAGGGKSENFIQTTKCFKK